MSYDRLTLLILANALEDYLSAILGYPINVDGTEDIEDIIDTATMYIAKHPTLINRIAKRDNLHSWLEAIREAKGELTNER